MASLVTVPTDSSEVAVLVAEAEEHCTKGRWAFARSILERLYALDHKPAFTAQHLGDINMNEGRATDAIRWFRQALTLDPRLYQAQEHLIFLLDAQQDTTEAEAIAERRNWWDRFGQLAYAHREPYANDPNPMKRLRVGYVSGDFNFHSAAIAFVNVITNHGPEIEPIFYSTLEPAFYDYRTKLWQERYGPAFVDVSALSASVLANTIRNDGIDLLVDLSGYTGRNRLLTFAFRPAPIQIQAWGYVSGTASPAIDVIFADPIVASPAIRATLTERVVDLPTLLSYLPRPDLPAVNSLPCLHQSPVFSVFQRGMKVTADAVATWRTILQRVPDARIMFKGADYSPVVRSAIADGFGDERARISFDFQTDHREHLLWYQSVDLALDTWPQTGGVSTLEALWMGVPTVTLLGSRMIQRASASFLTVLGLADSCIALTRDEYIKKAVALVTEDRTQLAEIRRTVRGLFRASPIMVGYVEHVERAYRRLWREWCATQERVHLWPARHWPKNGDHRRSTRARIH